MRKESKMAGEAGNLYWDSVPNPAATACYQHTLPPRPTLAAAAAKDTHGPREC